MTRVTEKHKKSNFRWCECLSRIGLRLRKHIKTEIDGSELTSKTRCVSLVRRICQIDFQTKVFVHASMTRTFAENLLGSEQYHIQLNNRSVKDRSFSRKIESERSFFVSESHRIDAQLKTVIDRTLARWTKVRNKEFYYIMKCADDNRAAMETMHSIFLAFKDTDRLS